jgi:mono/diheme cytochrome c family protein
VRILLTAFLACALAVFALSGVDGSLAAQSKPIAKPPVTPVASHTLAMSPAAQAELVKQYCTGCHNDRGKAGELTLAGWDVTRASSERELTEKMIHKLRAGMMPPSGARRPAPEQISQLVSALESRMDALAAADPNPGWRPFQRLNRAEYAREIKHLLDLDVDVTAFLPADTISDGFDNVADVQTFSPTLMEGYLRAASRIAMLAIGDPDGSASQATFKLPKTASQMARVDGAPPGTRGGISVEHTFVADGDYVFSMDFFAEPLGFLFGNTRPGEEIEVSLDGARLAIFAIDPRMSEEKTGLTLKTPPMHVKAGTHRVTAAFIQRFEGLINDLIAPIDHTMADTEIGIAYGITTLPHLRSLSVIGPHKVTGVSDTPSRRRVFACRPLTLAEETTCAADIVRRLATQAFRRPVSEKDHARLLSFYARGRKEKNFEAGITKALEAILVSPQFLFRVEETPARLTTAGYRLADYELATRLSFFLLGRGPDAELLKAAGQGRLGLPGALSKQAKRLLASPDADALATRFASQWLRLQDLEKVIPDPILYPYADQTLSLALKRETELFFNSLVREDRSLLDLLTADYTYANERVARHYGIPNVTGPEFRRVMLPDYGGVGRRGILGQGSVLTLTSIAERTSPVQRGKWVMEVLLGSPPPPPPPNVPALEETKGTADSGRALSVRERMEQHRSNPQCTSCHRVIDPLGLALENFDATGKWRIRDGGITVDTAGQLFDGTSIQGPDGLRAALLRHKDVVLLSFTRSLMTYALGRRVEAFDMPAVRRIIRDAESANFRISAFVNGVIESDAFRMARLPASQRTTTTDMPALQERR